MSISLLLRGMDFLMAYSISTAVTYQVMLSQKLKNKLAHLIISIYSSLVITVMKQARLSWAMEKFAGLMRILFDIQIDTWTNMDRKCGTKSWAY